MNIVPKTLAVVFCSVAALAPVVAQMCPKFPCIIDSSGSGEVASAAIDNFLSYAARGNDRVFVIARSGNRENLTVNLDRLCEARAYFRFRTEPRAGSDEVLFNSMPVIFAEGNAVEGEGRVEFYLGSRLELTRLIAKNRPANLNCCGDVTLAEFRRQRMKCREWKRGK